MYKRKQRQLRHHRNRAKIFGSAARPRMNVFRSNSEIYVQLIDDETGKTIIAASSKEVKGKGPKKLMASEVGKLAAQKAVESGIKRVIFDRGGYQYHGRVKELAEAARAAGLEF
jgi:large subunit ribosomal protein L18